jgi:hypothetical protein
MWKTEQTDDLVALGITARARVPETRREPGADRRRIEPFART